VFASTVEPLNKPVIGETPTGPAYEEFRAELAKREADVRERYYGLLETKGNEFRGRAGDYLFLASINRKNDAERIRQRNAIIAKDKYDRDIYGASLRKRIRRDDPVFAPLALFANLPDAEFAAKAAEVMPQVERFLRKREGGLNPIVAKAFAELPTNSIKTLRDVTAVYGKLFADADARADEYFQSCRKAKSTDELKGFEPEFVQLINVPGEIEPEVTLTFERLRELAPMLPVVNEGGYKQLQLARIGELLLTHPGSPARAMVVADSEKVRNSPIFIRGEQNSRGEIVPRRFLEIVSGKDRKPFTSGSGRLELAEAIASKDNPLTARVMVNRIWMHHFGQGFVRTPDDLGVQSEPPSHPELLDYLSGQFVANGWSMKSLHRLIMLSGTYQQNSETNNEYAKRDPDNRLLWRANLRRLDFEAVRDSMLLFTGKLDLTLGGKPVNLTDEPYSNRRSVYGYIDRGQLPELMSQFDFADPDMTNSTRTNTIVPQQALFFMNSPMAVDVARKVTSRSEFVEAKSDADRVKALYEVLFQRPPRAAEVRFASEFLQSAGAYSASEPEQPAAKTMTSKQEREAARAEERKATKEKRQMEKMAMKRQNARGAIRNTGELVERKPLTPWQQYAQALLFTNEIVYAN
jgi:uncharacterized protein DUF1553